MAERKVGFEELNSIDVPCTDAMVYEKGHHICGDPTSNKAVNAVAGTDDLVYLGPARESKTGTTSNTLNVELVKPAKTYAFSSSGITDANLFETVYFSNSSTVTLTAADNTRAGVFFGLNEFGQARVAVNY
jgi:hypothetical protein